MLDRQAERFGDRDAVVFPELALRWTYAMLRDRVDRLARGLIALGIEPGERVAVLAPSGPDWLLLDYALAKIGAVLVTVNTGYREHELGYLLRQGRVAALFLVPDHRGNDYRAHLAGCRADGLPALRHAIEIGSPDYDALHRDGVPAAALAERQAAIHPHDVVQIQYTSGTTGAPKGVMLTHHGTLNNARLMGERAGFDAHSRLLGIMPLFHTAGCVCNALGMLAVGGAYVGMIAFDAPAALALLGAERITVVNAVPTLYLRLLAEPGVTEGAYRASSTFRTAFTGGTSIPPAMLTALRDAFGADPMVIMGMTEASPLITQTRPQDGFERNSTSAGVPLPFTAIKIVDPATGEPVPLGVEGELCIQGYGVTPGYFDMPDRTAEAIDAGGWLHSGDLATLAADGTLRIVGRAKDMVIRGGENLYPAEIEALLMLHPAVEQAQIVGVPDPEFGEEAFAFIVLRPGASLTAAQLRDHARAEFSRHKVPRYIEMIDSLPQTASGKVKKFELRAMARARVTV